MKILLTVLLATLSATACATPPERKLSENEILALAKRASYTNCHEGARAPPGYVNVGCDYSPKFYDGTWTVMVYAKFRDSKGAPLQYMGGGMFYIFSPTGKLLNVVLGGM